MKTVSIESVKMAITKAISPKKAEKAADVAIKDGKELVAKGQDAMSAQGKAMIKPYSKPAMGDVKVAEKDMKAASGLPGEHDHGGITIPEDNEGSVGDIDWDAFN